jgi:hypothetical protein
LEPSHWYEAISWIAGTETVVFFMVDGRTGEVLQTERFDLHNADEEDSEAEM